MLCWILARGEHARADVMNDAGAAEHLVVEFCEHMQKVSHFCSVRMKREAVAVDVMHHAYIGAVEKGDEQVPELVEQVRGHKAVVASSGRRVGK